MDNTGNIPNNEPSCAPPREPPRAHPCAVQNGKTSSADNQQNTALDNSRIDICTLEFANIDPRLLEVNANLTATNNMTTQSTAPPNVGHAADLDAMDFNENPYAKTFGEVSSQGNLVAHSSHNGGHADGSVHGCGVPRGRGGMSRQTKRPRHQRDDEDDDDHEGIEEVPRKTKKRQKAAKEPEAQPVEIHRRFTSLRDRLIKGVNTPQNIGMRAYKRKQEAEAAAKAAAEAAQVHARIPPRDFLVPIAQEQEQEQGLDRTLTFAQFSGGLHNVNNNHWTPIHPNFRIAYKSTPIHQLHFPEDLVLALKRNRIKWNSKTHSEGLVFVVTRIVDSGIADMHVFSALQDATVDALYMMVNEHPEAFAMPREMDDNGEELKPPRMERATSVIREITARPSFAQVPMSSTGVEFANGNPITGGNPFAGTLYSHVQHTYYRGPSVQTVGREVDMDGDFDAEGEDDDSLFVVKGETPELPRPPRIADPQPFFNERGEVLLGNQPEPAYMFWGKYKITSFCLKMEARRVDGAPIKVSVHLKNLRKPVHEY
ncbi:hypothetical protein GGR51DRAFT_577389 [Nemania sp. FL0031]|nr:hypothetical protein GGR51DRAFT_577389 [Nemania sp. FL0031]